MTDRALDINQRGNAVLKAIAPVLVTFALVEYQNREERDVLIAVFSSNDVPKKR